MNAVFNFLLRALTKFRPRKEPARKDQENPTPQQPRSHNSPVFPNATASLLRVDISLNNREAPDPILSKSLNKTLSWHPPGSTPKVGAHTIPNGMVYIGHPDSPYAAGLGCVIDPSLTIALPIRSGSSEEMGYWPSYQSITPSARGAFLQWLSSGKSDPNIGIGYVFLYFYGLERRLLIDRPDSDEEAVLVEEIQRLRSIYAGNGSFDSYSRKLIEAVAFLSDRRDQSLRKGYTPDLTKTSGAMPLPLKIAIAQKVVEGTPLDFEWTAAGLIGLPWNVAPLNTQVVNGVRAQFLDLLRQRFEKRFPQGFRLRNRKTSKLQLHYQAAAAGLNVDMTKLANVDGLPDPDTLNWTKPAWLASEVCSALTPLAQALSRHPKRGDTLWAITLCPPELAATTSIEARRWLAKISSPITIVRFGELARHAIGEEGVKWTLRHHKLVAEALSPFWMSLEPDPASGSEKLEDSTEVVIVAWDHEPAAPSGAFAVVAAVAILVAEIARANVERTTAIEESWLNLLSDRLSLPPGDMLRVQARLCWLRNTNHGLMKARKILAVATGQDREFAVWSAIRAMQTAGSIEAAQIASLELLCDKLEVPRRTLYSILHGAVVAAASPAAEPVSVAQEAPATTFSIPRPPQPRKVGLDHDRLRRVRQETERVSSVLAEVFIEEAPMAAPSAPAESKSESDFEGLDEAHAAFVLTLIAQPVWTRHDFEDAAGRAGLMADGALEVINEWAFDQYDEALLDEGEKIEINPSIMREMAERRPAV
nr:TerB N-terminal domain-containing protein [Rhodoblastus acidophilus]